MMTAAMFCRNTRARGSRSQRKNRIVLTIAVLTGGVSASILVSAPASAFEMEMPLDCQVGKTCEIQHYVDRDGGAGAHDYHCGTLTYDGHKGTDFRVQTLQDMRDGVTVLAVAPGRVLRVRDKLDDVSVRKIGVAALKGQDCGNGLVIDHGDGWETQYCHMRLGSIVVRPGETVKTGQPLGQVGLSGRTEFPHLHVTLRKNGEVVDPFDYSEGENAMTGTEACELPVEGTSLWAADIRSSLDYKAGAVLNAGFTNRPIEMADIEAGVLSPPGEDAAAMVAYARAIGLRKGDVQHFKMTAPSGETMVDHAAKPLDHDKAQVFLFAGKKRPARGWPEGAYHATYSVERDGQTVIERDFETTIP